MASNGLKWPQMPVSKYKTEEFCQEFPCEALDRTCTFIRYFREVWSRKSNITLRSQRESQDKEKRKEEEKETLGIPKRISIHVTVANVLLLLLFVNEASYSLNQIKYTRRGLLRSTAAASPLLKKKKVWSQMPKAVHVSIFIFSPSICKKHLFPLSFWAISKSWKMRSPRPLFLLPQQCLFLQRMHSWRPIECS